MEDYDASMDIQEDMKKKKPKESIVEKPQSVAHEPDIGAKNSGPGSLPGPSSPVQDKSTKFCVNCGSDLDKNVMKCPSCGTATSRMPEEKNRKYCTNCGAEIDIKAEICPKCGVRQPGGMGFAGGKSPAIAALLSFLVVGLGQIYAGKLKRGIVLFAACVILISASFLVLPMFAAFACWIGSIYDAYKIAQGEPGPLGFIDEYTHEL